MNHRQRKVLQSLFAHPASGNIKFVDVEHMLAALGAEVDTKTHNRIAVTLEGRTMLLHNIGHDLSKDEIGQVRHFLESCGVTSEGHAA